jgi:hypothetical protein
LELGARQLFAVRQVRGRPWDWSRDMREQDGWDEHARFMDGLVVSGFVVLGGPLESDREVLLVVAAGSEDELHSRFADDPWIANGMLRLGRVERWTILLDGRH